MIARTRRFGRFFPIGEAGKANDPTFAPCRGIRRGRSRSIGRFIQVGNQERGSRRSHVRAISVGFFRLGVRCKPMISRSRRVSETFFLLENGRNPMIARSRRV